MLNLRTQERFIIAFLMLALLLGTLIMVYKKYAPASANIEIRNFKINKGNDIGGSGPKEKININEAGVEGLVKLKGVGKSLAKRIIDYRDQKGYFSSVVEIKNVRGIGDKIFDNIKDDITLE